METDQFVRGEGPYTFRVDMQDTTAAYDFALYTRVDGHLGSLPPCLPLTMCWIAPSDSVYTEQVCLMLKGKTSDASLQVYAPYREDVRPYEAGEWTLRILPSDSLRVEGLLGMGLVVEKKR